VLVTLRNVLEREALVETTKVLTKKVHTSQSHHIVGESEGIQKILHMIQTVAPTDARVLVTGANGSGKELVARQIHDNSSRASGPFVEVNCAAIPSELIESELFGHEKGAFTSAVAQRKGKFEQAQGGTLFLDEVGDMSASAQAKVLRALQENKISRVGSDKDISVDVRVVAATNKDLKAAIANGEFREDLYHRLAVVPIHVPALAERASDIPLLVNHFLDVLCTQSGRPVPKVAKEAMSALQKAPWTGNVRELRNAVERLLIFCPAGGAIDGALVKTYGQLA
jgi:DNA-binding NtrC family response regulator